MTFKRDKIRFLMAEPELGKLLYNCRCIETKSIKTAGVSITKTPNFYWNKEFFNSLTAKQKNAIFKHEMLHLVNLHPARGKELEEERFNYATDIAINQFIKNLPEGCLLPKQFNLKPKMSAEHYYNKLEGKVKEKYILTDGHSKWEESLTKEEAKAIMEKALEGVDLEKIETDIDYGTGHTDINKQLEATKSEKVNWKYIISSLRQHKYKKIKKKTIYRKNKRYDYYPGKSRLRKVKTKGNKIINSLFIAFDVSGSISDENCSNFFTQTKELIPYVDNVTLIQCSDSIHSIEVIKKDGKVIKELDFVRKGNGGTSFVPVFEHIAKEKGDKKHLVYLTDLMGEFPEEPENIDTVWVSPHEIETEAPFGEVFHL